MMLINLGRRKHHGATILDINLRSRKALTGWLLVTSPGTGGNVVAWYETESDCKVASEYLAYSECAPDRFSIPRQQKEATQ